MLAQIARETLPSRSANSSTDLLDCDHERVANSMVHEIANPNWAPAWL
jgi:hypothetical protein